jgi:hypothetical protein
MRISASAAERRNGRPTGPPLAPDGTLAGSLLIVGSIANIIVVNSAARRGIRID